ncbi:hypothetical protein BJN45_07905 [Azonexus hydrophilus]|uniref:DUF262 domain-containing protein n=1 Tax=Azonexus hydrophilus TaxID=418702 RepID=A0A1R1I8L9_9RHOO|nr:DUF262 domain-containing protein [Azonexus hydrophilus]OMG55062.1 hypothetical protein BJN45_07905 [Azonexus hydrophilus]
MAFSGAELRGLGDVLSGYSFVIPDYQRGYAWSEAQWKALWQDMENIAQTNAQQHFTGMMLLRPCKASTEANCVEVIDGQQRLITVMILANALRQRLGKPFESYDLTFNKNTDLQNFFDFYALNNSAIATRLALEPSSYALNIRDAAKYFEECASRLSEAQAGNLLKILLENFRLFILEVSNGFDIHVAFETLNNRGRRLSQMELLKNRLIYLTTALKGDAAVTANLRLEIHEAWKGIYGCLGRSPKTQNHDDEFLLAHATAYFKRKREAEWLEKTLFENTFAVGNGDLSLDLIRDYVKSLEHGAAWWSHIHAPSRMPKIHQKWLERIAHAGFAYFKPLLLSAYMRASTGLREAVVNPNNHENDLASVVDLLEQVERFIVIVLRLLGNRGSLGKADMDGAAYSLLEHGRDGFFSERNGINKLETSEAIHLVAGFVKAWVDNTEYEDGSFTDSRFPWSGIFSEEDVLRAVERRFRENEGYYKWDFARLAMYEYEESFHKNGNNPVKLGWNDFSFDETVEHIYPRDPAGKGKAYWDKHFEIDGRSNRNRRLSKALQNSVGNLLFLSRSANSSASNEAYTLIEKGAEVGKRGKFSNASYSATEVAQTFEHWNALTIGIRGVAILKFIERRWNINLSNTPDDLSSYLTLCFGAESSPIADGKAGKKIPRNKLVESLKQLPAAKSGPKIKQPDLTAV